MTDNLHVSLNVSSAVAEVETFPNCPNSGVRSYYRTKTQLDTAQ